jgi:hypothetical protein
MALVDCTVLVDPTQVVVSTGISATIVVSPVTTTIVATGDPTVQLPPHDIPVSQITVSEDVTTSIIVEPVTTTVEVTGLAGIRGPQGEPGPAGEGVVSQVHEAATNLSGHRAIRVVSGLAYVCDGSNASHAGRCIGISTGAVVAGDDVNIQTSGLLTEPSWNWADGPVYVGASGVLTQSLAGLAYIHQIGLAVSATQIDINPLSPILIF